jgi:hypothetical protein
MKLMENQTKLTRTGQDVIEPGLYASECCLRETFFDVNESFTRCPRCERLCEWELVDLLPLIGEGAQLDQDAA